MGVPCPDANTRSPSWYRGPARSFSSSWRSRWLWRALTARWDNPTVLRDAFLGSENRRPPVPFGGVGQRYKAVDQSQDYVGQQTIECVAHKTQRGATVLQHRSLLNYMTLVEGRRRDLDVVEVFGPGTWAARSDLWVKKSQRYLAEGAVYALFPVVDIERLNAPSFEAADYRMIPEGCGLVFDRAHALPLPADKSIHAPPAKSGGAR